MSKCCFDALVVAYGVHGMRLSVGAYETILCENVKWLQMFRDAQELILSSFKLGQCKEGLSFSEIRRHLNALRHILAHR